MYSWCENFPSAYNLRLLLRPQKYFLYRSPCWLTLTYLNIFSCYITNMTVFAEQLKPLPNLAYLVGTDMAKILVLKKVLKYFHSHRMWFALEFQLQPGINLKAVPTIVINVTLNHVISSYWHLFAFNVKIIGAENVWNPPETIVCILYIFKSSTCLLVATYDILVFYICHRRCRC